VKVIFLDRDGVINEYPGDFQYVTSWDNFHFLPQAKAALKNLNNAGFELFIISNQAGVSKGTYSKENLELITENMLKSFKEDGVTIQDVYYCIHKQEDNCNCRKPKTGMVEQAIEKIKKSGLDIELKKSYFIGDTIRDIETGKAAGLKTILVFSGKEKEKNEGSWNPRPDLTANNLWEASQVIIKEPSSS
jgi:histidinol-phosphate phosphatase family protein